MRRVPQLAALLGLSLATACTAPTDCSLEPSRCLPPAYQVKTAPAPQRGPQVLVPLVPGVPVAGAPSAGVPAADGLNQRQRGARLPVDGGVPAADQRMVVARRALSAALPALKAHDLKALRPFVTERYGKQFADIENQYQERFWRHADKVAKVLSSAHPEFTIEAQADGRLQATVKSEEGLEIRPVVVQEDGVWKLDRL